MSASAPNPNNMILLAVLGIGAYWLFTKQAMARPAMQTAPRPGGGGSTTGQNLQGAANLIGAIGGLFRPGAPYVGSNQGASGGGFVREIINDDLPGQPGYGWSYYENGTAISPNGTYYHQGVPVWSPTGNDAVAFNPPGNASAWDSIYLG